MRPWLPVLGLAALLWAGKTGASAEPFDYRPSDQAFRAFDQLARSARDGSLPRLSDEGARPVLLAVWNGVALEIGRPFEAFDTEYLRRACAAGQAVLSRYFEADEAAAAAGRPPEQRYWPEILEGVDFVMRCAAGLLQAHAALARRFLPGLAYAEARQAWDELRVQLVDQFNGPLRAIAAGALTGEAADRLTVAMRESARRIAGTLPEAERDALVTLARAAAARAAPLARGDLDAFAEIIAGR